MQAYVNFSDALQRQNKSPTALTTDLNTPKLNSAGSKQRQSGSCVTLVLREYNTASCWDSRARCCLMHAPVCRASRGRCSCSALGTGPDGAVTAVTANRISHNAPVTAAACSAARLQRLIITRRPATSPWKRVTRKTGDWGRCVVSLEVLSENCDVSSYINLCMVQVFSLVQS